MQVGSRSLLAIIYAMVIVSIALALATVPAFAQSPLGIGASEPSASVATGFLSSVINQINQYQQDFYKALRAALISMRQEPQKLWWLIAMSFAYGVFHAAGPGHGKVVIASYMIANEVQLKRGVLLSFVSALVQGLMAIIVVGATWLILRRIGISTTQTTFGLELASYALIMLIGLWLLWDKSKGLLDNRDTHKHGDDHHAHHAHSHNHNHSDHHGHHHDHHHDHGSTCSNCGHAHMPDPNLLEKNMSLKDAWSVIMAVGIRPCSGAIIVLTFSLLNGLYMGGILSVFAMAIGTAITVSALATLAVSAKTLALRFADGSSTLNNFGTMIEILGAILIILFGATLMMAALS